MARRLRSALVGAFVLGAVALVLAAIAIWGSGRWFRPTYESVCYFDGSVNGLSTGAPVKFRGVKIGWVKEIRMRYHQADGDRRIAVLIALDANRVRELAPDGGVAPIGKLVSEGLRARLDSESLVSGELYVDLRFSSKSLASVSQESEIPTVRSDLDEASTSVVALLERLRAVDFEGVAHSMQRAADGVAGLADSRDLHSAVAEMPALVRSMRRLTADLESQVGTGAGEVSATARDVRATLLAMRGTLDRADRALSQATPVAGNVQDTLEDVDRAARAVRDLADSLERNPSSLLLGRKQR